MLLEARDTVPLCRGARGGSALPCDGRLQTAWGCENAASFEITPETSQRNNLQSSFCLCRGHVRVQLSPDLMGCRQGVEKPLWRSQVPRCRGCRSRGRAQGVQEQPGLPGRGALFHLQHPKHWDLPRAVPCPVQSAENGPDSDPDPSFENSLVLWPGLSVQNTPAEFSFSATCA